MKILIVLLVVLALPGLLLLVQGTENKYSSPEDLEDYNAVSEWTQSTIEWTKEKIFMVTSFVVETFCEMVNTKEKCMEIRTKLNNKWKIKKLGIVPAITSKLSEKTYATIGKSILKGPETFVADILQVSLEMMGYETAGKAIGAIMYTASGIVRGFYFGGMPGALGGGLMGLSFWGITESPMAMKALEWSAEKCSKILT